MLSFKRILLGATACVFVACGNGKSAVTGEEKEPAGANTEQTQTQPVTTAAPAQAVPFVEGNGAIVEAPIDGSAVVAMRLMFYTGSIDDPAGKEGLTELTARLIAEGGTKKLSYAELLRALYPMAAEILVSVEKEQTVFDVEAHSDHAMQLIPILADMIREPRLPESDFTRLRDDMVNDIEKRLRATDDENLGKEMLNLMLYAGHPYGHFDGGTLEGLRAITIDDVRAHAAKMFGKKRLLIGIGGKVPEAREAWTKAVADLPDGAPRVASIPRVAKPAKNEVLIAEKAGKAVAVSIGFTHDAFRGHPDFSELGLIQSYFGEHRQFHGVLMSELREKRGLNYGDYAYVEKFIQDGWSRNVAPNIARRQQHFEMWIRPVDPKDSIFAIRLALFLHAKMLREGVSERGVSDTKQFLAGYTRLWDLTPSRRVGYALDEKFYGVSKYLDTYRADVAKMTPAEVNAAMRRHLASGGVKIAIVAPDAEALKQRLVSGEKSVKSYEHGKVEQSVLDLDAQVASFPLNLTPEDVKVVKVEDLFVR